MRWTARSRQCSGHTLTRRDLDLSTNRLARAFAERGVGVGDYVTIVLPNSIEWVQAVLAAWKLGATPTPLSARLPDAELEALLALRPQALIVGREDPRGQTPYVPAGFTRDPLLSEDELPEAVSPVWKSKKCRHWASSSIVHSAITFGQACTR